VKFLSRSFLVVITLSSLMFSAGDEAARASSLATKVFCSCGCREVLAECSHPECTIKGSMKRELASAVQSGGSDGEILTNLEKKYGADIRLVPGFHGFNIFLWIVPLAATLIAVLILIWRRGSDASQKAS
jgi:cytochrome c-type biogenesis protein CcmH/NrfF